MRSAIGRLARRWGWPGIGLASVAVLGAGAAVTAPPADRLAAAAETSLAERTWNQRLNAERCAAALNGAVLRPGEAWSFNAAVGAWTRDQGYRKAPVSYNGQLVDGWGGGVCQTSTTLYHAALTAGLEILERHPHQFAASYSPPGRDAAVAYPEIDLRVRNPYPFALRVHAAAEGDRLRVELRGDRPLPERPRIETEILGVQLPGVYGVRAGEIRRRNGGKSGYQVRTWRIWRDGRELISQDDYPVMHRIEVRR